VTTIAFDGACFSDGPVTGVGRSFVNALTAYAESSEHECVLLVPAGATAEPIANVRNVTAPRGTLRRQRQLPRLLRELGANLLHSSVASVPMRAPCPTIATTHDLPWLHPELHEPGSAWRQFATRYALRTAARIIAPSTMTKNDVQRLLGTRCPPIELVLHGTTLGPAPTEATTEQRNGPFLVLGDDRPRKNLDRLRVAHELATRQCADLPAIDFVGPPNRYIGETEKNVLLQTCRAVVHVSLFEGFGMPVLEGLANGAPVVCSDLSPHREIATEHALFVDSHSLEAIAAGLQRIHTDTELRWQLAQAGHARANQLQAADTAAHWQRMHAEVLAPGATS